MIQAFRCSQLNFVDLNKVRINSLCNILKKKKKNIYIHTSCLWTITTLRSFFILN